MQNHCGSAKKNNNAGYSQRTMSFETSALNEALEWFDAEHSDMVALGKRLGAPAVRVVCEVFGGRKVHVPEFDNLVIALRREARDEEIKRKFRGNNLAELAHEYRLSARHVHRILHGDRSARLTQREITRGLRCGVDLYERVVSLAGEHHIGVRDVVDVALTIGLRSPELDDMLCTLIPPLLARACNGRPE